MKSWRNFLVRVLIGVTAVFWITFAPSAKAFDTSEPIAFNGRGGGGGPVNPPQHNGGGANQNNAPVPTSTPSGWNGGGGSGWGSGGTWGGCPIGYVPDPLDPNCEQLNKDQKPLSYFNRFIKSIPIIIAIGAIIAVMRAVAKIIMADSAEKRSEGFGMVINIGLGTALFYALWLVLFLIEYFTGAKVNVFG